MSQPDASVRGDPSAALQARFETIWRGPMAEVPMVNPKLRVQSVGFRPWGDHWLGVLVTPWFMNLVLMPRVPARWEFAGERASRFLVFPAGVFEFIGGLDEVVGQYQACSLFSPMFEFDDPDVAAATAAEALQALFDPANQPVDRATPFPDAAPPTTAPGDLARPERPDGALSKRDFLFGGVRAPRPTDRAASADGQP